MTRGLDRRTPQRQRGRRRRHGLLAVVLVASAIVVEDAAPASAANPPFFSIQTAKVPVQREGKTYRMSLGVTKSVGNVSMDITLTRTAATGNRPTQTHTWTFILPGSAATFSGDLTAVSIQTGDGLGHFGEVAMELQGGAVTTTQNRCPSGLVVGSTSKRTGTLRGAFDFDADDGFFDVVHRTTFTRSTATKISTNGKQCPGGGGGGCFEGETFFANRTGPGEAATAVNAFRRLPSGRATITFSLTRSDEPAAIAHNVQWSAPRSAFTVSDAFAVVVDGNTGAPWASGILRYRRQGPLVDEGSACRTTVANEVHDGGRLVAKLDSPGQRTLGAGNFASATRTVKT